MEYFPFTICLPDKISQYRKAIDSKSIEIRFYAG
jgi:hypothetical protein